MKTSEERKELRMWRAASGLCTKCGRELPEIYEYVTCEKCRAQSSRLNRKYSAQKRAMREALEAAG